MCLRAIKTKHYSQRVPLIGTVGYRIGSYWDLCFKQFSCFQNLRRKGGKREAKGPATNWFYSQLNDSKTQSENKEERENINSKSRAQRMLNKNIFYLCPPKQLGPTQQLAQELNYYLLYYLLSVLLPTAALLLLSSMFRLETRRSGLQRKRHAVVQERLQAGSSP